MIYLFAAKTGWNCVVCSIKTRKTEYSNGIFKIANIFFAQVFFLLQYIRWMRTIQTIDTLWLNYCWRNFGQRVRSSMVHALYGISSNPILICLCKALFVFNLQPNRHLFICFYVRYTNGSVSYPNLWDFEIKIPLRRWLIYTAIIIDFLQQAKLTISLILLNGRLFFSMESHCDVERQWTYYKH